MNWFHDTEIAHEAIVQSTDSNSVKVLLINNGSCSGCHAESSCGMSGNERKEIIIPGRQNIPSGSRVTVLMKQSTGFLALFLGYMLPLGIFLLSMVILNVFSVNELASGLISLGSLLPYYLVLSVFRKSIDQKFSFTIKD